MSTTNKFNSFVEALTDGVHHLKTDTLKVMLTDTAPSVSNTQKSDIVEIAAGNGYTAGGLQATLINSSQINGLYSLKLNNVKWAASGGSIGPFRYAVLYNDSASNKELIAYWDVGFENTLQRSETFGVTFDGVNGILQLT